MPLTFAYLYIFAKKCILQKAVFVLKSVSVTHHDGGDVVGYGVGFLLDKHDVGGDA